MKTVTLAILFIFGTLTAYPASDNNNYDINKLSPLALLLISDIEDIEGSNPSDVISRYSQQYVLRFMNNQIVTGALLKVNENIDEAKLKSLGITTGTKAGNIWTARIPLDKLDDISFMEGVDYIEIDIPVFEELDEMISLLGIDEIHDGSELNSKYTGKDVVIGVIDGGFYFNHPMFTDKIKRVWIQSGMGDPPSGYNYGTELKGSKIANAGTDHTSTSHGSHVAGIAGGACNDSENKYKGVAPGADLVFVSYLWGDDQSISTGFSYIVDAVDYIFNYANTVGKPAVINISLGLHIGPHDGSSLFDQACNNLMGRGRIIVTSAGNSAMEDSHVKCDFSKKPEYNTGVTFYESNSFDYCYIDMWGEEGKDFCATVTIYYNSQSYHNSNEYCTGNNISESENVYGDYSDDKVFATFIAKSNEFNGRPRIFLELDPSRYLYGKVLVKLRADEGIVHMWHCAFGGSSGGDFYNAGISNSVGGNSEYIISELGGANENIITVGAYTSRSSYYNQYNYQMQTGYSGTEGDIAPFSSNGPTTDMRIKPDICAPGNVIVSAINSYDDDYFTYMSSSSMYVTDIMGSGSDYYAYAAMQGTSMSAPVVTGVIALMLDAYPALSPKEAIGILKQTALNDYYTGNVKETGDVEWGYGKVDPWQAVKEAENINPDTTDSEISIRAYPNPASEILYVYFENQIFGIYNITLTDVLGREITTVKHLLNLSDYAEIDMSNLAKGMYYLKIEGQADIHYLPIVKE